MIDAAKSGRVRPLFRVFAAAFALIILPIIILEFTAPHRSWGFIAGGVFIITVFGYAAIFGRAPYFLK